MLKNPGHDEPLGKEDYKEEVVELRERPLEAQFDMQQRAFEEINDFEAQLTAAGIIVVKFWLAIDSDTQLARFRAREASPLKRYKITGEDWRNRARWDDYAAAVDDMVARTGTDSARWTVVDANDKRHARVQVLKTLNDAIERAFAEDKRDAAK